MNGIYGTKKPAYIKPSDADVYYHYRPTRSSDSSNFSQFQKLESSEILFETNVNGEKLPGLYDLRLPLNKFGEVGIYTIYIKPKEIITTIVDVGTLNGNSNIRGVVLNANNLDTNNTFKVDGALTGYRIEYFDTNNENRRYDDDTFRLITSSNKCQPISQSFINTNQNNVSYTLTNNSNLLFCTVTPSVGMSFESNSQPFIGTPMQKIALINTKFNPVMLEIEITEHDIESLSTMMEFDQIRNLDKGIITTFNNDGEIYHQAEYGNIVNKDKKLNHDFRIKKQGNYNFDEVEVYETIQNEL